MSVELREELHLLPGPTGRAGEPTWTLHDPVRNLFFRIDWPTFEILARWSLGSPDSIVESIRTATPLQVTEKHVEDVARFLVDHQLVTQFAPGSANELAARHQRLTGSLLHRVIHHYLFFRIPLINPDAWLTRMLPLAAVFFSATFRWLTLLAGLVGVGMVSRHWDRFITTLIDTATLQGVLCYALALVTVKILHELGHAFTAKRAGCKVPAMGVAFLVMWPMPYTDTNDSWRLIDNKARLAIASAGIVTELAIALWATLAWAVLPDGALRTAVFFLATTSWVATLAVNASPFMRFDGYFILSDWLDMPNLHARSFALARWHLREVLFGLDEDAPEYHPAPRRAGLIAFAWATWIYRVVLFVGIALLVYHFFFKALGVILFLIEIGWFILLPMKSELTAWWQRRHAIAHSITARRSLWITLLLVVPVCLPWPGRVQGTALIKPAESVPIFAPQGARIEHLPYADGDRVPAGALILQFAAPDLAGQQEEAGLRHERLRQSAAIAGLDPAAKAGMQVAQAQAQVAHAAMKSLEEELLQYRPRAPFEGVLRFVDPDLAGGQWVAAREKVALLTRSANEQIETFLDEDAIKRISVGAPARFIPDSAVGSPIAATVTHIDRDATRSLPSALFSSHTGGGITARERNGQWVPERAAWRVTLRVLQPVNDVRALRGKVIIEGEAASPAAGFLRQAAAVLVRESGM